MKNKNKKIGYKQIYIKTLGMFILFYVVVMGIFTGIQSQNNRYGFRKASNQLINQIEKDLIETVADTDKMYETLVEQYGAFVTKEEFEAMQEGDLAQRINNYVQGFYSGAYAKVGIYDEDKKEWIARSGNYLYSWEQISLKTGKRIQSNEDRECLATSRAIPLEEYLDLEQMIELRQLYMKRSNEHSYNFKVKGYRKGNKIIPETIQIYEQDYEEKDGVQKLIDEVLIKAYAFDVSKDDSMEIYENEGSDFIFEDLYDTDFVLNGSPWQFDKRTYRYFTECSKAFEVPYLSKDTVQGSDYTSISLTKEVGDVVTRSGEHLITLYAIYFPWQAAMKQLIYVYLFSLVMVILLVSILSRGLWKIYQKQEALEKGRRLLVDGMSHELKTPLSLIRTYSEGLKERIAEDKKDEYLAVIIEETYKMDEMILEMLDLSKLETDAYVLKKQDVNLRQLIDLEKESKQKLLDQNKIQVLFEVDQTYYIKADEKRMRQVVSNLLMNAILHTPYEGKIVIRLKGNKLEIENEGKPIPQNQKEHIWEAFYKGDTAVMDYQKGTGLGLAIVREILKLHQFDYGVENTRTGVKFFVRIN